MHRPHRYRTLRGMAFVDNGDHQQIIWERWAITWFLVGFMVGLLVFGVFYIVVLMPGL